MKANNFHIHSILKLPEIKYTSYWLDIIDNVNNVVTYMLYYKYYTVIDDTIFNVQHQKNKSPRSLTHICTYKQSSWSEKVELSRRRNSSRICKYILNRVFYKVEQSWDTIKPHDKKQHDKYIYIFVKNFSVT